MRGHGAMLRRSTLSLATPHITFLLWIVLHPTSTCLQASAHLMSIPWLVWAGVHVAAQAGHTCRSPTAQVGLSQW